MNENELAAALDAVARKINDTADRGSHDGDPAWLSALSDVAHAMREVASEIRAPQGQNKEGRR